MVAYETVGYIFEDLVVSFTLQCLEAREDKNPLLLESVSSRIEPFKYEGVGGGLWNTETMVQFIDN